MACLINESSSTFCPINKTEKRTTVKLVAFLFLLSVINEPPSTFCPVNKAEKITTVKLVAFLFLLSVDVPDSSWKDHNRNISIDMSLFVAYT